MSKSINDLIKKAHDSFESKKIDSAINYLNEALLIGPLNFNALHTMGVMLGILNKHQEAKNFLKKATEVDPNNYFAQFNYANSLLETGEYKEAIFYYEIAIKINQSSAEAWTNYGKSLFHLKEYSKSLDYYENALRFDPNYFPALINKSNVLILLGKNKEALISLNKAVLIDPLILEIWLNMGLAFARLDLNKEALGSYNKAIQINPNCSEAYYCKASVLLNLELYEDSLLFYKKALDLEPNLNFLFGRFLSTKMKICEWNSYSEDILKLTKKIENEELAIEPLTLLSLIDDPELQMKLTANYTKKKYSKYMLSNFRDRSKNKKIRLGYYSSDFRKHAIGFLTAELFEEHNRNDFELFAFSFCDYINDDKFQNRIIKSFDKFIHVNSLSDLDIINLSKDLNIDIAIDLNGYTKGERTGIFANRAAPIQVNYLGYPGTMAANFFDYIIADRVLISEDNKDFFSEKIVFLPHTYQPNDNKKIISDKKYTRLELGLKEDQFIFCSFNANHKITPQVFNTWINILKKTNDSVIWLLSNNYIVNKNLKLEAEKRGISSDRLVFSTFADISEHLARISIADLFLDTLPYNAHTTASDALFVGLPILTLMGKSFQGRVTASLLMAVGIPELITKSFKEYEDLAVELATNKNRIKEIRDKLNKNISTTPLFNTKLYAKNLEKAYKKMYENYYKGSESSDIYIN
jgi:predicted O-linked N-acetylglucosamine transferase (SPINDLY family)